MALQIFGNVLNAALHPLLALPPLFSIAAIALMVSFFVTIITKYTTNQKALKALRAEMKELQKAVRASRSDMKKSAELNKKLIQKTGEQMRHTMRSYIFTILPVILIFSWLGSHVAFYNIEPGEEFTTTAFFTDGRGNISIKTDGLELLSPSEQEIEGDKVIWKLKGEKGAYNIEYYYGSEIYKRKVIITDKWEYADPVLEKGRSMFGINMGDRFPIDKQSSLRKITVDLRPVRAFGFSIFGWKPGWLATYLIAMLAFTFPLRKVFNVH